jgi:hypothetical protein
MTTRPPLEPEDQALYDIRTLLTKAHGDAAFRAALINDPISAAAKMNIKLRKVDADHVLLVKDVLNRFSSNTGVDPDDAASWATGVLLRVFTCQNAIDRWGPGTLSIQRFAFACAPLAKIESSSSSPDPQRRWP